MWLVWTPRFGPLTALLLGQVCLLVSMLLLSVANGLVSHPLDFDLLTVDILPHPEFGMS